MTIIKVIRKTIIKCYQSKKESHGRTFGLRSNDIYKGRLVHFAVNIHFKIIRGIDMKRFKPFEVILQLNTSFSFSFVS